MSDTVCFYCGNDGTSERPLVRNDDDNLVHDAECLPLREGFGKCYQCWQARPLDRLAYTTLVRDPRGFGWNRTGFFLEPTASAARPAPAEYAVNENDVPYFACYFGGCRNPYRDDGGKHVSARRVQRDEDMRQHKDDAAADETRLAQVPPRDEDPLALADLMLVWQCKERSARQTIARLLADERIVFEERPTKAGGARRKVYWRAIE
jgi:hypothetical protein